MKPSIVCIFTLLVAISPSLPVYAQRGLTGNWEWKSPMDKERRQTIFGINLNPKNGNFAGTYFFNDLQDGETESDGAVAGFIGTVVGNVIKIEFDPEAADPGYSENVRYKRPKGRLPSTATLTFKNAHIEWVQTRGILSEDMPKTFILSRSK